MWLDRLSGTQAPSAGPSTPQTASRHNSPLPRRVSSNLSPYVTSQRPGHSPRGSSLSLVSNGSTTSLLPSSRKPNGLAPKPSFATLDRLPDPVNTLAKLLKPILCDGAAEDEKKINICEKGFATTAEFGGQTLKELATYVEPDDTITKLWRPQTVEECLSPHTT